MPNEIFALALTVLAGLATGIGAAIAFLIRKPTPRLLSLALGFSAGVMLYVSFTEMMPTATEILGGNTSAQWLAVGGFFAGIGVIAVIDWLVPRSPTPTSSTPQQTFSPPPASRHSSSKKKAKPRPNSCGWAS